MARSIIVCQARFLTLRALPKRTVKPLGISCGRMGYLGGADEQAQATSSMDSYNPTAYEHNRVHLQHADLAYLRSARGPASALLCANEVHHQQQTTEV